MKLGIRNGKTRPPLEASASPAEGAGGHPTFVVGERDGEPGQASRPDLVSVGTGEPYRPRHAAEVVAEPLDSSASSTAFEPGRHQR